MGWQITFEDEVYRSGDLTLDQVDRIDAETGERWSGIVRPPASTPALLAATIGVLHGDRTGQSYDDIVKKVRAFTADDLLDSYELVSDDADLPTEFDDGFPPKAAEPSTDT